jgi:integrase
MSRPLKRKWPDPTLPPPPPGDEWWPLPFGARWRKPNTIECAFRRKGSPAAYVTKSDWPAAATWLAEREREFQERGRLVDRRLIDKTTLSDALKDYLKEETPLKRGAAQETQRIKYWLSHPLGERFLSSLTVFDFESWVKSRIAERAAPTTITNSLSPISKTFQWLARRPGFEGLANPIRGIARPRANEAREAHLTADEEVALLAACEPGAGEGRGRRPRSPWLRPIVQLALTTAMRQGELRDMKWKDVHFHSDSDTGWIVVPKAKAQEGTRSRKVPLVPAAVAVLRERLRKN